MERELTAEEFNSLPKELQIRLLNTSPLFPRINKNIYESGEQSFRDTYCNLPISTNEFRKYVARKDVDSFATFVVNDLIVDVNIFYKIEDYYDVRQYSLLQDNIDVGEYSLIHDGGMQRIYDVEDILEEILNEEHIYYDVKSVNQIIAKRGYDITNNNDVIVRKGCNNSKDYTLNYVKNIVFNLNDGVDIGLLFFQYVKLMYLAISDDIVKDVNSKFYGQDAEDLIFDDMGQITEDFEEEYDILVGKNTDLIKKYYNNFITWLG